MSTAAVAAWQAYVKDLQALCQLPDDDELMALAVATLAEHGDTLQDLPPLPNATWRKLVVELQVPLQLCRLLVSVAEQESRAIAAAYATDAVGRFLQLASGQGITGPTTSTSLSKTVWQQLEESGLLQQLPAWMAAAAEELAAHTGSRSTRISFAGRTGEWRTQEWAYARDLLQLLDLIQRLSPASERQRLATLLSVAPATLQLSRAAMQCLNTQCQQQQQQEEVGSSLPELTPLAFACCCNITHLASQLLELAALGGSLVWYSKPEGAALLQSPNLLHCLALVGSVGVFAATGKWKQARTGAGSSAASGSSSSSSRTASADVAATAWKQVSANLPSVTPSHQKLFQLLGVDSRTVLWAAGVLRHTTSSAGSLSVHVIAGTMARMSSSVAQLEPQLPPQGRQVAPNSWWQDAAQRQRQQALHMLLPSLWLPWGCKVAAAKPGSMGPVTAEQAQQEIVRALNRASTGCRRSLERWAVAGVPPEHVLMSERHAQAGGDAAAALGADTLLQPQLPPELLAELLPQALQLLGVLLAWRASSSSSTPVPGELAQRQVAVAGALQTLCLLIDHSVLFRHKLQAATTTAANYPAIPQPVQGSLPAILELLDSAVRYLASQRCHEGAAMYYVDAVTNLARLFLSRSVLTMACIRSAEADSASGLKQLQQLYSLFISMLKLTAAMHTFYPSTPGALEQAGMCRMAVADAAMALLTHAWRTISASVFDVLLADDDEPTAAGSSSGSSSTAPGARQWWQRLQGFNRVSSVLPCLPLLGRCFLQIAQHLQPEIPRLTPQRMRVLTAAPGVSLPEVYHRFSPAAVCLRQTAAGSAMLKDLVQDTQKWLLGPGVPQQLGAAGCQPQQLLQSLQSVLAAQQAAAATGSSSRAPQPLTALVQELTAAGHALCSVAVPEMCNSPSCTNVSGPSDIALVSGRSCLCAGCKTARYCGRDCQVQHWPSHRPVCRALKAMAAAAAAAGSEAAGSEAATGQQA